MPANSGREAAAGVNERQSSKDEPETDMPKVSENAASSSEHNNGRPATNLARRNSRTALRSRTRLNPDEVRIRSWLDTRRLSFQS
eukprot:522386-Rhodomonas_salina.1